MQRFIKLAQGQFRIWIESVQFHSLGHFDKMWILKKILKSQQMIYIMFVWNVCILIYRKGRRTRNQIANVCWIIEKKLENSRKNICLIEYIKAFDCMDHSKLWKILKDMGIPDHLTWLLQILYAAQEATVTTGRGMTDWFQIGKGVCQGCIVSPCSFTFYAEYIMQNARLGEAQAGIKIARRKINNLRYADDICISVTLMAESKEELKSHFHFRGTKVKEESEKAGLKLNIQKINSIWPHHFMTNRWGNNGNSNRLYFFGFHNYCRWWPYPWD